MKGKMKATLMVAVMVFSMASACFVGMSSEDTSADTPSKVILGQSLSSPYLLYTDDLAGTDASIEFNESAFSFEATKTFKVNNDPDQTFTLGVAMPVSGVNVTITDAGTSGDGHYCVNFVGKTAADGSVEIRITLSVIEKYNGKVLTEQLYDFVAFVKVVNNTAGNIVLADISKVDDKYPLSFDFEKNVSIPLSVTDSTDTPISGYVFYGEGLPSGISVTRTSATEFAIGGKVENTYAGDDNGTGKIYAVSQSGRVLTQDITWSIAKKPTMGELVMKVNGSVVADGGYVYSTTGANVSVLTVETSDSSLYKVDDATASIAGESSEDIGSGLNLSIDGSDTYAGTGIFTVTVEADIVPGTDVTDVKTVHVTQSFTVYIVPEIVDADLDPVVRSN